MSGAMPLPPKPRPVADPEQLTLLVGELERLTGDAVTTLRVGIAVSGGPDSMALLYLLRHLPLAVLQAATVDHGLRPEAAEEAAMVARYCAAHDVAHRTLAPPSPVKGSLQSAAREARYALLDQWRAECDLDYILTAHHADDQAETLVMRLNRGSGVAGLGGIRSRNGRVLRPMLGWRRAALVQIATAAALPVVDDPSNYDRRFDRSRIRAALADGGLLDPKACQQSAALLAAANDALDWAAAEQISDWPDGSDPAVVRDGPWPAEIGWRILRLRMAAFGDRPDADQRQLLAAITSLRAGQKCSLGTLTLIPDRKDRALWRLAVAPQRRA
jgi:tRNA(Ile)-lysidine synthase